MYIGIDLGTSAVKLILADWGGSVKKTVSKSYPLLLPHSGWSEQDPEEWYNKTVEGIRELIKGEKAEVLGIGIAGQMHGLVMLDEHDAVIRPAILWNDGRSVRETEYLNNEIGRERLSSYTANIAFAGFTAPKLLWVKNNEPENFKKIKKIMLPKDYLVFRLTGQITTDVSDASGMLFMDVQHKRWSPEMLSICGITEDMLPRICESSEVVGTLLPNEAEACGLGEQVKVVAGAGDNAAAAIGAGTVGEGRCNISIGTSGTVFISSDSFHVAKNNSLHSFAHADGHYHQMGCMLSAASCSGWWFEKILATNQFKTEEKYDGQPGTNRVMFAPYLMGERSPHNDAGVRGAFIGLSLNTTRHDMTTAVLEGVAFGLRDSIEAARAQGIDVRRSTVCGGGAKSGLWVEILSNILNMEIDILQNEEGPALGAALLAAVGCGEYANVREATRSALRVDSTIYPDATAAQRYNERYAAFCELYPAIRLL